MSSTPASMLSATGNKDSLCDKNQSHPKSPSKAVDQFTTARSLTTSSLAENQSPTIRQTLSQMDIMGDEVPPPSLRTSQTAPPPTTTDTDGKDWQNIRQTERVLQDELERQAGAMKQEDC
ncbi:hypothetical protein E2P81_ATG06036 [Venturia nashicola]|uniref:Uncharacterized protein n=1 Tax=Venturia nashicola TaxID=86259 RepID=A0A4Z1NZK1_9PEZI|nr:hypothetical protein E6O75_ATG06179 [Venturia nashicola]TLD29742.1 hypothetical protein E2P81_ATG06036 [Venturia nashicola]